MNDRTDETAKRGASIYDNTGARAHEADLDTVRGSLDHAHDEKVLEQLALPSALWSRLALEKPDDKPVDEYIEWLTGIALTEIDRRETVKVQTDVELDREQWERLRLDILLSMQTHGKDVKTAFWDHVNDHVQTTPNLVVNGDVVGPQDVTREGDDS